VLDPFWTISGIKLKKPPEDFLPAVFKNKISKFERSFRFGAVSQSLDILAESDGHEQRPKQRKSHQIASSVQQGNQNDQRPGKKQVGHAHPFRDGKNGDKAGKTDQNHYALKTDQSDHRSVQRSSPLSAFEFKPNRENVADHRHYGREDYLPIVVQIDQGQGRRDERLQNIHDYIHYAPAPAHGPGNIGTAGSFAPHVPYIDPPHLGDQISERDGTHQISEDQKKDEKRRDHKFNSIIF